MPKQLQNCPHCGLQLVPSKKDWLTTREMGGMTQREMAKLLNVKASHIAYLENGRRNPSGDLILKFLKVREDIYKKAKQKAADISKRISKEAAEERGARKKAVETARAGSRPATKFTRDKATGKRKVAAPAAKKAPKKAAAPPKKVKPKKAKVKAKVTKPAQENVLDTTAAEEAAA